MRLIQGTVPTNARITTLFMFLRLSRLSFWLSAVAAMLALCAPSGHATFLTACSSFSCLFAVAMWRSAAGQAARELGQSLPPPGPAMVEDAALREAAERIEREVGQADGAEAAWHAAARVLRNELGPSRIGVHAVLRIEQGQAVLSERLASRPRHAGAPRQLPLDRSAAGQALQSGRAVFVAPGEAAVPVRCGSAPIALIVLEGLMLAVEPVALVGLLGSVQRVLSEAFQAQAERLSPAPACAPVGSPDGGPSPDHRPNAASGTQFGRPRAALRFFCTRAVEYLPRWPHGEAGALTIQTDVTSAIARFVPHSPGDLRRVRDLGTDDHPSHSARPGQQLQMLNRDLPKPAQAAPPAAPARTRVDAGAPVLDAEALARLTELDPSGENRLIERVMQAFKSSVARLRAQLDAARSADDRGAIKLVVHTLKSSSASIGGLSLSAQCADMETVIRTEPQADLGPRLDALELSLDAVLSAIDALLKERA